MTVENYLAEAGALATLAGLLAGFGISAVIQFLTMDNKSKLVSAAIITFSTSTVMFLYSLIVSILLFAAAAELGRVPTEKDGLATWAFLVIVGAIFVFLTGIGITGWIRSRTTGIITTIVAAITMCLTASVLWSVLSLFG
jgi:drug/metabolite transporter (DMT)-like permease